MQKNTFIIVAILLGSMLLLVEPALAGPGGKIAKAAFESFWGRIVLFLLVIFFLPLILYTVFKEKLAERRALKDLKFMAVHNRQFDWLLLQKRIKDCFLRVHSGWQNEDLSRVNDWMTNWYWQNQQQVYLDDWKSKGLKNVCEVKKINSIKPILFSHRNTEVAHEDSVLIALIDAEMKDYLENIQTGEVVEGSKKLKDVETVWSLIMEDGVWKVADIEESSLSLAYAKMAKDLPAIETTLLANQR